MTYAPEKSNKTRLLIATGLLLLVANLTTAQERVDIAVVRDGQPNRLSSLQQKYVTELLALTGNEFDVRVEYFSGDWSKSSIEAAIDDAYNNSQIDIVLVNGFVASQIAATRAVFSKPTFLPLLLDTGLVPESSTGMTSSVRNLNYLSAYAEPEAWGEPTYLGQTLNWDNSKLYTRQLRNVSNNRLEFSFMPLRLPMDKLTLLQPRLMHHEKILS